MRDLTEIRIDLRGAFDSADRDWMDRLAPELSQHDSDTSRCLYHGACGARSRMDGDLKSALEQYEKSLQYALETGNQREIARAEGGLGMIMSESGQLLDALTVLERSTSRYTNAGDLLNIAVNKNNTGNILRALGSYAEALEHYEESHRIYEDLEYAPGIKMVIGNMANVYRRLGQHDQALMFHEEALRLAREQGDTSAAAGTYGNIGNIHADRGDREISLKYYEQALAIYRERDDEIGIQRLLISKAMALSSLNNVEGAWCVIKELSEKTVVDPSLQFPMLVVTANCQRAGGDLAAARQTMSHALDLATDHGLRSEQVEARLQLAAFCRSESDLEGYILHSEEASRIREEIVGAATQKQIALKDKEREIQAEREAREKERAILYSTLPAHVADRIIRGEDVSGDKHDHASVLFLDVVGFTTHASQLDPQVTTQLLDKVFETFDEICERHGVTKIKTIGDSYLAVAFGEATSTEQRAANVALEMMAAEFYWPREASPEGSLERLAFRIGIHSGPVVAGVIGKQRLQYDVWGDTVNVASRMESTGEPGRVQCSEAFAHVLSPNPSHLRERGAAPRHPEERSDEGPLFTFIPRGEVDIKGKGPMTTYWLENATS